MNDKESCTYMGFLGGLTLVFIAAKLFGHLHWPWFLVLSPLWLPFAFIAIAFIVLLLFKEL